MLPSRGAMARAGSQPSSPWTS